MVFAPKTGLYQRRYPAKRDGRNGIWRMLRKKYLTCALVLVCLVLGVMPMVLKLFTVEYVPSRQQQIVAQTEMKPVNQFIYRDVTKLQGTDLARTLKSLNLWGKHSDFVFPPCGDPTGVNPNQIKQLYDFVDPSRYLPDYKNPCWSQKSQTGLATLRCIPYFYVIGTTRAATTDLFNRILMHPHVSNVTKIEKRWFERERFRSLDKSKLAYYIDLFKASIQEVKDTVDAKGYHYKIIGDDSPSLSFLNTAWKLFRGNEWCQEPRVISLSHLHHLLPSAKLILLVRNPVERLYADFLFNYKVVEKNATLEEFHMKAAASIEIFESCFKERPFRRCLYGPETFWSSKILYSFTSGIYSRLIMDILQIFPRRQLHVIRTEHYKVFTKANLVDVFRFLNLDPLTPEDMQLIASEIPYANDNVNKYDIVGDMLPETRKMLTKFYQPFNEELSLLLNDNKYMWLGNGLP